MGSSVEVWYCSICRWATVRYFARLLRPHQGTLDALEVSGLSTHLTFVAQSVTNPAAIAFEDGCSIASHDSDLRLGVSDSDWPDDVSSGLHSLFRPEIHVDKQDREIVETFVRAA